MVTISQLPKFYQDNYEYVGEKEVYADLAEGMEMPFILIKLDGTEELVDLSDDILNAEFLEVA